MMGYSDEDGTRQAFWDGYDAGNRYHMNFETDAKDSMPNNLTYEQEEAWKDGFNEAGADS